MRFKSFLFLCLFGSFLSSQEIIIPDEETYYASELVEFLQKLEEEPLNVNTAKPESLYKLPWLERQEIKKILILREKEKITSWQQLQNIGIDEYELQQLKPYLTFQTKFVFRFRNQLRLEMQESDLQNPSSLKYYQKFQVASSDFRFGFLTQKDPGEKDIFDFYSYYLEFFNDNLHAVIGKYRLTWGLGLAFASKLGFSKTSQTSYTKFYNSSYIDPYTSSYEIWDLQGVATEYRLDKVKITSFASYSQLSANLSDDKITSFNSSGIHLNSQSKNNVDEKLAGMALDYNLENTIFGLLAVYDKFGKKFYDETLNSEYSLLSGYMLNEKLGFPIFVEVANANGKLAAVGGIRFGSSHFKHLFIARYYPKNFPTWHGKPFAEKSNFDNEQGFYYGLKLYPIQNLKLNFYFDIWKHAKTNYWEKMPTSGSEQFAMLTYKYGKHIWRFSLKNSNEEKYKSFAGISKIRDVNSNNFSLKWRQNVNNWLTCDSYGKLVNEYLPNSHFHQRSFLFYQQFRLQKKDVDLTLRLSTHHGEIPVYVYENNVDGIMQNRVCSGEGINFFTVCSWKFNENIELQLKFFDYLDRSNKAEFYFQVLTRF
ncbi:MAG: hypothetical protein PWQ09_1258 [Candidatus Cloacimonadota bacterium]|jgi:hypothetical protein|nr:hypothetical protein [Candidatus Cloacimonadota bacterium]